MGYCLPVNFSNCAEAATDHSSRAKLRLCGLGIQFGAIGCLETSVRKLRSTTTRVRTPRRRSALVEHAHRTPRCRVRLSTVVPAPAPGHVRGGAEHHADARHHRGRGHRRRFRGARRHRTWRCQRLRQAEVEHLHDAVRSQLDVGRLQVAVDDPLLVGGFERLGDLRAIGSASSTGIGPCAMRSASVGPSTSSMTSAVVPSLFSRP